MVRFDDWDISGEDHILEDGFRFINEPYFTAYDVIDENNTVIVNSFCASDTLFCVLNTPSGLELAKLDDAQLVPVHLFRNAKSPQCAPSSYLAESKRRCRNDPKCR